MSREKVQGQFKLGFADSDLKTPKHDEIMIALDNQMPEIIDRFFTFARVPEELILRREDEGCPERLLCNLKNFKPTSEYVDIHWEQPIENKKKFIIGFADMLIVYHRLDYVFYEEEQEWDIYPTSYCRYFEIKTSIPSLGELIRQIRYYQTAVSAGFTVVSPDIRFAEQLKKQRINFIRYHNGEFSLV